MVKKYQEDPKLKEYAQLSVFNGKYKETADITKTGGVNVIGNVVLSDEEKKVLGNNPKMAVVTKFDEEVFDKELEVSCSKVNI